MTGTTRISLSLDHALAAAFDQHVRREGAPSRSKAFADLIRRHLVEREWAEGREVAGAVTVLYDRHRSDLVRRLNRIQHDHHRHILAVQHFHLDHHRCLEILAVRGRPEEIRRLVERMSALKGIKAVSVAGASTGRQLP